MKINSLSIIIPSYNEAKTLEKSIKNVSQLVLSQKKEIIVVDDGSSDESRKIISRIRPNFANVTWISHKQNLGKGSAIKSALKIATGDYVIIHDADLECDPQDIPKLVRHAETNSSLAVFGSRNRSGARHLYFYYHYGGVFLTKITNFLYKQKLTDVTNCYKLVNRKIFKELDIQEKGFGVCMEIAAKLSTLGINIDEHPVSYFPRSFKEGKKLRMLDGLRCLYVLLRIFMGRLLKNYRLLM